MAGLPVVAQRAIADADADALTLALLQTHVEVLYREAAATANVPRAQRLAEMYDLLETMRRRVVARKQD